MLKIENIDFIDHDGPIFEVHVKTSSTILGNLYNFLTIKCQFLNYINNNSMCITFTFYYHTISSQFKSHNFEIKNTANFNSGIQRYI